MPVAAGIVGALGIESGDILQVSACADFRKNVARKEGVESGEMWRVL